MTERGYRRCTECGAVRPSAAFRYPNQLRHYAPRCDICRSAAPTVKCKRCEEYKPVGDFRALANGGHSRTCNACFGSTGNHVSVSVRAVHAMLDAAGIPDGDKSIEERVKLLIHERNAARCMERKALKIAIPLMRERYERRRRNNTVRQMLESEEL